MFSTPSDRDAFQKLSRSLQFSRTDAQTLCWTTHVSHVAVTVLKAQLSLSSGSSRSCTSTPQCSVEIWAQDTVHGEEELAYCRGSITCRAGASARIHWLGRSNSRAVHEKVKAWRCVGAGDPCRKSTEGLTKRLARRKRTVAEALLGIAISIFKLLGAKVVEFQAMDNGSGKLIEFYRDLGFVALPAGPGEIVWMEAMVSDTASLAPPNWLSDLVPPDFDAQIWLHKVISGVWLERLHRGRAPKFSWELPSHVGVHGPTAMVEVRVLPGHQCGSVDESGSSPLGLMVLLSTQDGQDLAVARASVQPLRKSMLVHWLGGTHGCPADATIKGKPLFETAAGVKVTHAIGLLGVLAAGACWFAVQAVQLQTKGPSSALVKYLMRFGFVRQQSSTSQDAAVVNLTATSRQLVKACCPVDWFPKLLREEDLDRTVALLPHDLLTGDSESRPGSRAGTPVQRTRARRKSSTTSVTSFKDKELAALQPRSRKKGSHADGCTYMSPPWLDRLPKATTQNSPAADALPQTAASTPAAAMPTAHDLTGPLWHSVGKRRQSKKAMLSSLSTPAMLQQEQLRPGTAASPAIAAFALDAAQLESTFRPTTAAGTLSATCEALPQPLPLPQQQQQQQQQQQEDEGSRALRGEASVAAAVLGKLRKTPGETAGGSLLMSLRPLGMLTLDKSEPWTTTMTTTATTAPRSQAQRPSSSGALRRRRDPMAFESSGPVKGLPPFADQLAPLKVLLSKLEESRR